jgi:AraC family transcriptional regulator
METCRYAFDDFVVRAIQYPAGRRMPRHDHAHSNVTAVIRGEMVEETDFAEHRGRSSSVLLKPAGTAHANAFLGRCGVETISIEFAPRSRYSVSEWAWIEEATAARAAVALRDAVRHDVDVEASALALLALVLPQQSSSNVFPPWLTQVVDELHARFGEPIRFDTLAREAGLHPVYVSRAFRRFKGTSMSDYVRALRLREARHLLGSTDHPLADVAAETGFADASHLCRTFATAHAMTPAAYRAACG